MPIKNPLGIQKIIRYLDLNEKSFLHSSIPPNNNLFIHIIKNIKMSVDDCRNQVMNCSEANEVRVEVNQRHLIDKMLAR